MSFKPEKEDFAYNSQLDAFELYHLVTQDSTRPLHREGGPILPALGHALAGSFATATSKLLIYPLDLVIARLQVQKQLRSPKGTRGTDAEYKGLIDAASKIYQHEGGLSAFYTGCSTDVAKGIADSFLFFLAYSFLQQRETRKLPAGKKRMTVAQEMGIGIVAGAFSKLITTPLQNIITRQQTAALALAHSTESDDSLKKGDKQTITDIARQIHKEQGLSGFWTGYSLSLILTLNPAITFAVDNFLQKALRARDAGARTTFLVAAISKAIATTITYPVSVAKSRAQAKPQDQPTDPKSAEKTARGQSSTLSKLAQLFAAQYSVLLSLRNIYRQDGVSGLYSGIEAEVLKGFLSHGLTMMMKDRVHSGIVELYYMLLKLTSSWPADIAAKREAASEYVTDTKDRIVEAGKDFAADASNRAENIGSTAYEAGKNIAEGVSERAQSIGNAALDAGRNFTTDASERAGSVGSTALEAGRNASAAIKDKAESALEAGTGFAAEARSRAEKVGVTVYEAGKSMAGTATEQAGNASSTAASSGTNAFNVAKERAENIGVTVVEAGKSIAGTAMEQANNATGSTVTSGTSALTEAKERAENFGVSVVEAGKSAVGGTKK